MFSEFYNHIFYLTVVGIDQLTYTLIGRPLIKLSEFLKLSQGRIDALKQLHLVPKKNPSKSTSPVRAISWFLMSLTLLILSIALLLFKSFIQFEVLNSGNIFIIASLLSFIINWQIIWSKDRYKKYFHKFKKQPTSKTMIFIAILFNMSPLIFIVVSILINCNP